MCCFCLNVEGLACCLNVIVSYKVRNYVWSWIAANNQASTRKSQWVCVIHSWTSNNFSEIFLDKVLSSMKLYDNLIEMRALFSKKSGTVHYFRTYIVFRDRILSLWNESCWICWMGFSQKMQYGAMPRRNLILFLIFCAVGSKKSLRLLNFYVGCWKVLMPFKIFSLGFIWYPWLV